MNLGETNLIGEFGPDTVNFLINESYKVFPQVSSVSIDNNDAFLNIQKKKIEDVKLENKINLLNVDIFDSNLLEK